MKKLSTAKSFTKIMIDFGEKMFTGCDDMENALSHFLGYGGEEIGDRRIELESLGEYVTLFMEMSDPEHNDFFGRLDLLVEKIKENGGPTCIDRETVIHYLNCCIALNSREVLRDYKNDERDLYLYLGEEGLILQNISKESAIPGLNIGELVSLTDCHLLNDSFDAGIISQKNSLFELWLSSEMVEDGFEPTLSDLDHLLEYFEYIMDERGSNVMILQESGWGAMGLTDPIVPVDDFISSEDLEEYCNKVIDKTFTLEIWKSLSATCTEVNADAIR